MTTIVVGDRRISPEEVVSRMSEIASEDESYRRQLVDLAATRGGIYRYALSSLHELEKEKLDEKEADERLRVDDEQFATTKKQHFKDTQRRLQAKLASEVASGLRIRAQAREEYRGWRPRRPRWLELPVGHQRASPCSSVSKNPTRRGERR